MGAKAVLHSICLSDSQRNVSFSEAVKLPHLQAINDSERILYDSRLLKGYQNRSPHLMTKICRSVLIEVRSCLAFLTLQTATKKDEFLLFQGRLIWSSQVLLQ